MSKGGNLNKNEPVNYRPISVLNGINKVFEKLLYKQISNYLEDNKHIPHFQYGYRRNHSTQMAIMDFYNYVRQSINNNQYTIAVFMDLSKAFDTVDKDILYTKMQSLGFESNSNNLIYSYMSGRQFCFANDDNQYADKFSQLYKKSRNIKIVQDAMFSSTNEVRGTSYRSRLDDPKYRFAGKTGTSQVKKITERDRELDLKTFQIPYEERDHALYVAFGPYKNPRYALSIIIEHGGSGGTVAAPLAKELFKMIVDRHEIRKNYDNKKYLDI